MHIFANVNTCLQPLPIQLVEDISLSDSTAYKHISSCVLDRKVQSEIEVGEWWMDGSFEDELLLKDLSILAVVPTEEKW